MIQVFRRKNCLDDTITLRLNDLVADAEYEVENLDEPVTWRYSGRQLVNGDYSVTLSSAPCSAIITYKKIL